MNVGICKINCVSNGQQNVSEKVQALLNEIDGVKLVRVTERSGYVYPHEVSGRLAAG